uniref:Uncharacterized protein n=1 Tax=Arundo donax TaxID=35708 RepID=A0A0A9E159_ARUDO
MDLFRCQRISSMPTTSQLCLGDPDSPDQQLRTCA